MKKFSNDVIYGNDFAVDVIHGDTEGDINEGRGGNDLIFGLGGSFGQGQGDNLYGDAANLRGTARGGNDILDGGAFADLLHGDAAVQLLDNARGGHDWLIGGTGNDTARGDALILSGQARGGDDLLEGGEGNDTLYGDATFLRDDSRGGHDRLDGGAGNDQLWGDAMSLTENARGGHDIFAFAGTFGNDSVMDFRSGEDLLEFDVAGVDAFEDLAITQTSAGTVITVEGYGSVTLAGVTGIGAADIVFA